MDQIGHYQNEIPALSALPIQSYERIFKIYTESLEDKEFYYYNILKKIDFPDLTSDLVEFYTVAAKTPMTTISYDIYGDIKSWWIIYLINKDKFDGPPFWVDGGVTLKYLKRGYLALLYQDITQDTIYGGRHY